MIPESLKVAEYIENLPAHLHEIAVIVREIIFMQIPDVEERFKWAVPFYVYKGNLCYLNVQRGKVILAFYWGVKMSDPAGIFDAKDRKQIRHIVFSSIEDVSAELLAEYLQEAVLINTRKELG